GENRVLGRLVRSVDPPALVIKNAAGDAEATLTFARAPGETAMLRFGDRALRLYDDGSLLRLLDKDGVPLGQVGRDGARAIAWDPGGRPLAAAERADAEGDRRLLRAVDGSVRKLVGGLHDDRAAAALAVEGIPLVERVLVARWLDK